MTISLADPWFTIEPIDAATIAISEYGHWEETHAYLVIGKERAALIDTGLGVSPIDTVVQALTTLPITVLTTHVHWDHIGGHGAFPEIAVHPDERAWLEEAFPIPVSIVRRQLMREPFRIAPPAGFDISHYTPFRGKATRLLRDGDGIDLGGRTLKAIHTPGHSPGHLCFYEQARGYLFTGDLLYAGTLYANYPSTDPAQFAASTAPLVDLPWLTRILPGHHRLVLPVALVQQAHQAWQDMRQRGQLHHGGGTHHYGMISI
ncbi:MAG TPA: MBL fold metallo-hydrolase, partial [Armatimonadota bacterium]|nr:MBL fold metallo-hydrolase [Armatimonadota bacterium]